MSEYISYTEQLLPKLISWRRAIHQNPEVGMDLPLTKAFVKKELEEMGYKTKECGGGIIALIEGSLPGKTFLLRADMDALPMTEESGLPFASKTPNAAHTCGHDMHTSMLLGAARLLMGKKDQIRGRVKLMFQPGEEVGAGARSMIEAGLLEDPAVDAALGIHVMVAMDLKTGQIGWYDGPALASGDMFRINVEGKGCHASRPETGIDPINILCHIHTMLQTICTKERPQKEAVVLGVCQISAGDAHNVIPSKGFMAGTLRTYNQELRDFVKRRIKEIAEGVADTLGGKATVSFGLGLKPTINNKGVCKEIAEYFRELVGKEQVVEIPSQLASEDFSEVLDRVPGAFFRLGVGSRDEGFTFDGHNSKVVFNEAAMPVGAAAYAYAAVRWLENHAV